MKKVGCILSFCELLHSVALEVHVNTILGADVICSYKESIYSLISLQSDSSKEETAEFPLAGMSSVSAVLCNLPHFCWPALLSKTSYCCVLLCFQLLLREKYSSFVFPVAHFKISFICHDANIFLLAHSQIWIIWFIVSCGNFYRHPLLVLIPFCSSLMGVSSSHYDLRVQCAWRHCRERKKCLSKMGDHLMNKFLVLIIRTNSSHGVIIFPHLLSMC